MKKILAIVLMAALLVCPAIATSEAGAQTTATSAGTQATAATADQSSCNHSFTLDITKEATCTEKGLVTYTCSQCGLTYTVETAPTGEHSYVESRKEATCTEDGAVTYTCSVCGDSYSEVIPATGHVPSAAEPTCTEDVVCTVCGEVLTAATGHSYTYQYDAVTAEDGSYTSYGTWKCDNCGDVIEATEGNAVYYYGLLESGASGEASTEASGEASGETTEEETTEVANPNYDPDAYDWNTISVVVAVAAVVVCVILMLSFGKATPYKKKED